MQNKQKHTLGLSSSLWKVRGVLEHREILKTLAILRKGILFRVSDFSYIYNLVAKTYKFTQLPEALITKGFSNRVINTRQTSILYLSPSVQTRNIATYKRHPKRTHGWPSASSYHWAAGEKLAAEGRPPGPGRRAAGSCRWSWWEGCRARECRSPRACSWTPCRTWPLRERRRLVTDTREHVCFPHSALQERHPRPWKIFGCTLRAV